MNAAQITTARTESRLPLIYTTTTVASFHYTNIIRTTNNKVLNPLIPKLLPTYKVGDAEEAALPGAK
jgi:hypothetical protein